MYRIGFGTDSHAFETEKKKLVLAGTEFEGNGLKGNSDGDAVLHALCNAICSALGKGSLSIYSDKMCSEGITDSKEYLKIPLKWMKEKGYEIENVSIALECKKPKIEPKREEMKKSLSKILEIEEERIGITATSGEGLTEFGKGNGVMVQTTVLLHNISSSIV